MNRVIINGQAVSSITVRDRGFQYGDGLFETMLVLDGKLPFWSQHSQRLVKSCERLSIPCPDICLLRKQLSTLIEDNHQQRAVIKLIITRGSSERGYATKIPAQPHIVMMLNDYPDYPLQHWTQGIALRSCQVRLAHQPVLAGIKHLNRLEQVIARSEWSGDEYNEGIMYDQDDNVIEAISANIFIVNNQQVFTPALDRCGVEGVMRNHVLQLLSTDKITTKITNFNKAQLLAADEVFVTNSVIGIWPVKTIDQTAFSVGQMTRKLQDKLIISQGSDEKSII